MHSKFSGSRFTRLVTLSIILIFGFSRHASAQDASHASVQDASSTGKSLFISHCSKCHGEDGTKGRWGAKNLRISRLDDAGLFQTISNGRGFMPKWSKKLSEKQIADVITYIKTLRK